MRSVLCAVAVLVAVPVLACPAPRAEVRQLETANVSFRTCRIGHEPVPVEIASVEELATSAVVTDEAGREAIRKQIDFAREKLVVFVWAGSSGDRLTAAVSADGTAEFVYAAGETDDLLPHTFAFAVPQGAKVVRK